MMHSSFDPPVLLSTEKERDRARKKDRDSERRAVCSLFQEQSGLEAIARQPGPQREKKGAFNMGGGTADISTLRRTNRKREREREEDG